MPKIDGMELMHVSRKGGRWALIAEGNYLGGGRYRLEIRKTKLGCQVWFDGAPASGYLKSLAAAVVEMKLLDAEERLAPSVQQHGWTIRDLKKAGAWSRED